MSDVTWSGACLFSQAAVMLAGMQHITDGAFLRQCAAVGDDAVSSAQLLAGAADLVAETVPNDVLILGAIVAAAGFALRLAWQR